MLRNRINRWQRHFHYKRDQSPMKCCFCCGVICALLILWWTTRTSSISDRQASNGQHLVLRRILATTPKPIIHYDANCKETIVDSLPTSHVPWETCTLESESPHIGGWIVLYIIGIYITFVAVAVVCDDFFIPSLDAISEKLNLSEDVAGATFMAAGSSAPELFSSVAAVTFQSDVGVGTITGSAVFNLLVIVSLTAAFSKSVLHLDWRPLSRDSLFYAISIAWFIYSAWDTVFQVWEAVIMLVLYALYIVIMYFNTNIMEKLDALSTSCSGTAVEPEIANGKVENSESANVSRVSSRHSIRSNTSGISNASKGDDSIRKFKHDRRNSLFVTVTRRGSSRGPHDEVINFESHNQLFVQPGGPAGTTSNVDSKSVASLDTESTHVNGLHSMVAISTPPLATVVPVVEHDEGVDDGEDATMGCDCCPIRGAPPRLDKPDDEEEATPSSRRVSFAVYIMKWLVFVPAFPFLCLYSWTIPDCAKPEYKKWFIVSFLVSVLWIAAVSFAMVTLVARLGCILGIDSFVMSLIILAMGTSVPDLISSIIVARDGFGDMAVSNAIGSNVFDINLGLGLPFLIRIIIDLGEPFDLFSQKERAAYCTNKMLFLPHPKFGFILLFILLVAMLVFLCAKFRLNKGLGISFFCLYIAFLVYAFLQEIYCNKPGSYNC